MISAIANAVAPAETEHIPTRSKTAPLSCPSLDSVSFPMTTAKMQIAATIVRRRTVPGATEILLKAALRAVQASASEYRFAQTSHSPRG